MARRPAGRRSGRSRGDVRLTSAPRCSSAATSAWPPERLRCRSHERAQSSSSPERLPREAVPSRRSPSRHRTKTERSRYCDPWISSAPWALGASPRKLPPIFTSLAFANVCGALKQARPNDETYPARFSLARTAICSRGQRSRTRSGSSSRAPTLMLLWNEPRPPTPCRVKTGSWPMRRAQGGGAHRRTGPEARLGARSRVLECSSWTSLTRRRHDPSAGASDG